MQTTQQGVEIYIIPICQRFGLSEYIIKKESFVQIQFFLAAIPDMPYLLSTSTSTIK